MQLPQAEGAGVRISDRDGLGLATVIARKGQHAALAERIRERFGIELPRGPLRTAAGALAIAGTGPDRWLASQDRSVYALAETLKEAIGDLASVSDQSDGYAVLRLSGPNVRDALCELVAVDVHPRGFRVGDVAVTAAGHIGATIWRLEDDPDGSGVFEIAVFRSFAASFWDALTESAAEFGVLRP